MPCSRCGASGHNVTTCPHAAADNRIAQAENMMQAKMEGIQFGAQYGGDNIAYDNHREYGAHLHGHAGEGCNCVIS